MDIKNNDFALHGFITDFAESNLTSTELQVFSELMEANPNIRKMSYAGLIIHNKLRTADKIRAMDGFEKRMSARFAQELRKESEIEFLKSVTTD